MFSLLTNSQIYGLQAAQEQIGEIEFNRKAKSNSLPPLKPQQTTTTTTTKQKQHRRANSSLSDCGAGVGGGGGGGGVGSKFFGTLSSMQGMKSPTNFIEKFIKTDLLSGYDTLKNYNNNSKQASPQSGAASVGKPATIYSALQSSESILNGFNCLQGSYRSNCDGEFYEAVHIKPTTTTTTNTTKARSKSPEMTIRCSKNLLADSPQAQSPATLQNYQKLPEYAQDLLVPLDTQHASSSLSSGASSGEFNTDAAGHTPSASNNLYKKLSFGARLVKHGGIGGATASDGATNMQGQENNSDNSSSSLSTNNSSAKTSEVQRSSSGSSTSHDSGSGVSNKSGSSSGGGAVRKKTVEFDASANVNSPERIQRRKLLQMISAYDQQNKMLQRELAKEKRRRTEELACVVKSLICFESKLKTDMKSVNQRLQDKDAEICRLVRQNRALRKKLANAEEEAGVRDEGVVVGGEDEEDGVNIKQDRSEQDNTMIDCLVLEALQCINCRKQFYDIEVKESCTQTLAGGVSVNKECSRASAQKQHEHGSSSDDTVASSFYGARRSVRYTSKRTAGTFRDYMRSRAMNIDDPALEQGSEENTSTISREDSQTSYEQLHNYSRAIERMHGVQAHESSEQSSLELMRERSASRMSNKSNASRNSSNCSSGGKSSDKAQSMAQLEEDDGIFSPTQDDEDYEEEEEEDEEALLPPCGAIKIMQRRTTEFSEASPKQIYETSTDDWYASASDQEDQALGTAHAAKSYGNGAVNPVLECVNQILLQQSMEESVHESPKPLTESTATKLMLRTTATTTPKTSLVNSGSNLPRRSSLSGRRSSMQELGGVGVGVVNVAIMNQRASSTLTRKRVHFSTKNSMVHVPRNDEHEDESDTASETTTANQANQMISQNYHTMAPTSNTVAGAAATTTTAETLNYESIYSNEYEPIGSEHPSHLYVDMDAATVKCAGDASPDAKHGKLPPALPPKPANLLKFKKSLQQLDEVADEQDCAASTTTSVTEPDYCSISEVNVAVTCVQIVADVHKAPPSETAPPSELDLEVSTVASDDTFAASQKTDEIEEIFADIPKLPNVAAIIAPKQAKYQPTNADLYLTMTAKTPATTTTSTSTSTPLKLQLSLSNNAATNGHQSQYKRKHVPNILAEINKRMSLPNSPTTPKPMPTLITPTKTKSILKLEETHSPNLPLQAEFDWYNLDAEYGKTATLQPDLLKSSDCNGNGMLAEIKEVSECVVSAADEYNLDEEFNMAAEEEQLMVDALDEVETLAETAQLATIKSAIYSEHSPLAPAEQSAATPAVNGHKSKKIKKNLANFEKFIEGSGLSTKPLPSKRKIYFSGPFV